MKCCICFKSGADLRATCGHAYHDECFKMNDWNLSCHVCNNSLAHCHFEGEECYVGVKNNQQLRCRYKITRDSLVKPVNIIVKRWKRNNGRLHSRELVPLKYNICVS